jgi:hypothetical protein
VSRAAVVEDEWLIVARAASHPGICACSPVPEDED